METAQMKTTEAQRRANKKYSSSKWRPNIYIDPVKREVIEKHFTSKGFRSFNEYVMDLIDQDMDNE